MWLFISEWDFHETGPRSENFSKMMNLKLNECGCGCSLRTGTLIVLWSTLVFDGLRSLLYFGKIIYDPSYSYLRGNLPLVTIFLDMIFLTACIFGMAVATFGIYGIQKNRSDFLNLCYYYYAIYAGYWIFIVLIIIIYPSAFFDVTIVSPLHMFTRYNGVQSYTLVYALAYVFLAVFTMYIALVIKSCKDKMTNNPISGFDPEMPDPSALGYSASL